MDNLPKKAGPSHSQKLKPVGLSNYQASTIFELTNFFVGQTFYMYVADYFCLLFLSLDMLQIQLDSCPVNGLPQPKVSLYLKPKCHSI